MFTKKRLKGKASPSPALLRRQYFYPLRHTVCWFSPREQLLEYITGAYKESFDNHIKLK